MWSIIIATKISVSLDGSIVSVGTESIEELFEFQNVSIISFLTSSSSLTEDTYAKVLDHFKESVNDVSFDLSAFSFFNNSFCIPTFNLIHLKSLNIGQAKYLTGNSFFLPSLEILNAPMLTHIDGYFFFNHQNLIRLIANEVTFIGESTFENCSNFQYFETNKLSFISKRTFANCKSLYYPFAPTASYVDDEAYFGCTNITEYHCRFADSIGNRVFANCTNLINITMFGIVKTGSDPFLNCISLVHAIFPMLSTLLPFCFHRSQIRSVVIPSCKTISQYAFAYSPNLVQIVAPSVELIESHAFRDCYNLQTVEFPACSSIEDQSFRNCFELRSIICPSCQKVGHYGFANCSNLVDAQFPSLVETMKYAFSNCASLSNIDLMNLATADDYSFEHCGIETVDFCKLHKLGVDIFSHCNQLVRITLDAITAVTSLGKLPALKTFRSIGITHLMDGSFLNTSAMVDMDVPNLERIGARAFLACSAIKYFDGPNIKYIDDEAFANCTSLLNFSSPNLLTMGKRVFEGSHIGSFSLPMLETICENAFFNCTYLTNITTPSMKVIFSHAFDYCASLSSGYFPSLTKLEVAAFCSCVGLINLTVPKLEVISTHSLAYCTSLEVFDAPSLTTISGYNPFFEANALTVFNAPSLTSVNASDSTIFHHTSLQKITLGPSPPPFHKDVFANFSDADLEISNGDYSQYMQCADKRNRWLGLKLPKKELLSVGVIVGISVAALIVISAIPVAFFLIKKNRFLQSKVDKADAETALNKQILADFG